MPAPGTMMAALKGASVGRKRAPPKGRVTRYHHKFARRLHELAADVTNKEIAKACGVSPMAVSKWFAAQAMPNLNYWPALARVLRVETRDLLPPE